jgi:hypothetical protein
MRCTGEVKSLKMKKGLVIAFLAALIIPAVYVYAARLDEPWDAPEGSVFGRDVALQYILESYPELSELVNPSTIRTPWHEENLNPYKVPGSTTVQFTKGDWTVKVSNAVVLEPVYTVEVEFTGDIAFCWIGTVDQAGNVGVIEFSQ